MSSLRALTALLAALLAAPHSLACGGFFSPQASEGNRRPSLAHEQTLIVFDADKKREHFVREVVFRAAHDPFGFVVPTPARPEVGAVKSSPFEALRTDFPFQAAPKGGLRLDAAGSGASRGMGGGGVEVLEIIKVGSFTAFVLAATDDKALAGWLAKNGFASTKETDAWLAHYVKLKFYYVAMRYEPPKAGKNTKNPREPSTKAETIRISFDTPRPYYPYLEPLPAAQPTVRPERLLDVWLVSRDLLVPVATHEQDGKLRWVRPLATGERYTGDNRAQLQRALGAESKILPPAVAGRPELSVQRFMDQKRTRGGFGDIVFVPANQRPLDAATRSQLAALLPLLDPRLLEAQ
jgi:hypothetical protein